MYFVLLNNFRVLGQNYLIRAHFQSSRNFISRGRFLQFVIFISALWIFNKFFAVSEHRALDHGKQPDFPISYRSNITSRDWCIMRIDLRKPTLAPPEKTLVILCGYLRYIHPHKSPALQSIWKLGSYAGRAAYLGHR